MSSLNDCKTTYPTGVTKDEAYWRTTLADLVWEKGHSSSSQYRRATPDDCEAYESWISSTRAHRKGVLDGIGAIISANFQTKTFFVTRGGYFGLCPQNVSPGDHAYVFLGSKIPFICRLSENTESMEGPSLSYYRLIGDCYVHGFMDGEALDDKNREQNMIYLC
jgi:hypothetical protein